MVFLATIVMWDKTAVCSPETHIELLNKEVILPSETGVTEITFLNKKFLGEENLIGKTIYFFESEEALGEIKIIELLNKG